MASGAASEGGLGTPVPPPAQTEDTSPGDVTGSEGWEAVCGSGYLGREKILICSVELGGG